MAKQEVKIERHYSNESGYQLIVTLPGDEIIPGVPQLITKFINIGNVNPEEHKALAVGKTITVEV